MNLMFRRRASRETKTATVADVMVTAVVILSPTDTFAQAVVTLAKRSFRHLVIVDQDQKVLGIISDRDILRSMAHLTDWHDKLIRDLITAKPITATPQTLLSGAISTMISNNISCLPVVTNTGTVCGIVTSIDIMNSYQRLLESIEKANGQEPASKHP